MFTTVNDWVLDIAPPELFLRLYLLFCLYSVIGWAMESSYRSLLSRRWVNSGFLHGPFVPIYGFGAMAIFFFDKVVTVGLHSVPRWTLLLLLPSLIEYLAGYILNKTIKAKLWDYANEFLNIRGYICLKYSSMWAVLVVVDVFFLQPRLEGLVASLGPRALYLLGGMMLAYVAIDTWQSIQVYADFKRVFQRLKLAIRDGLPELAGTGLIEGKLPLEWRRFLRPLQAFPSLRGKVEAMSRALPQDISERIRRLKGRARQNLERIVKREGR